jgi:hypothetical protein
MAINMSWRPATADWAIEETGNSLYADERNFYKVEKWSKDDQCIECMLWAGNSIEKARQIFNAEVRRRPGHPHSPAMADVSESPGRTWGIALQI